MFGSATAIGLALLLSSCGGGKQIPAAITVSTAVATKGDGSLEHRIYQGINAYRGHRGLTQQTRHSGLDAMARAHARKMLATNKFAHSNYEYREVEAIRRYRLENLEENILRAFRVPEEQMAATTVKGWIESRSHRINLETLNSHVGVGVAVGENGELYAVQLTGTPKKKSVYNAGMPRSYGNVESEQELSW